MILGRLVLGCVLAASTLPAAAAETSDSLHALINKHAKANGLPESLVHRVVRRESNYNPRAYSRGNWGLMQIRHGTARGMGYTGSAAGLLDANTNLSYAVPYLANAYRVAGGNPDRAVSLYASGFYYHAKRQGMLGSLKKGPLGGDAVAQAQPAQPTFGSWLATAFAPPGQAQQTTVTQQTVVAQQSAVTQQPVAVAQTQPEVAEEPAGSVSRRRGRRERLALAKAAAQQSRTESKAQEAAPAQPATQQLALRQAVSETPEAAPAAKHPARRDRTAALSKTAALGSAAEPQAQKQAQAETPAQPPQRPAALNRAAPADEAGADAAPTAKRLTKRDRAPALAKLGKSEARVKDQPTKNALALPPELATRR